jgi:hypothetical protein
MFHPELIPYLFFAFFKFVQHIWFIKDSQAGMRYRMASKFMTICCKRFYLIPGDHFA